MAREDTRPWYQRFGDWWDGVDLWDEGPEEQAREARVREENERRRREHEEWERQQERDERDRDDDRYSDRDRDDDRYSDRDRDDDRYSDRDDDRYSDRGRSRYKNGYSGGPITISTSWLADDYTDTVEALYNNGVFDDLIDTKKKFYKISFGDLLQQKGINKSDFLDGNTISAEKVDYLKGVLQGPLVAFDTLSDLFPSNLINDYGTHIIDELGKIDSLSVDSAKNLGRLIRKGFEYVDGDNDREKIKNLRKRLLVPGIKNIVEDDDVIEAIVNDEGNNKFYFDSTKENTFREGGGFNLDKYKSSYIGQKYTDEDDPDTLAEGGKGKEKTETREDFVYKMMVDNEKFLKEHRERQIDREEQFDDDAQDDRKTRIDREKEFLSDFEVERQKHREDFEQKRAEADKYREKTDASIDQRAALIQDIKNAPSTVEEQARQSFEQNLQNQAALSASLPTRTGGSGAKMLADQARTQNAQIAAQTQVSRLQEQLQRDALIGDMLSGQAALNTQQYNTALGSADTSRALLDETARAFSLKGALAQRNLQGQGISTGAGVNTMGQLGATIGASNQAATGAGNLNLGYGNLGLGHAQLAQQGDQFTQELKQRQNEMIAGLVGTIVTGGAKLGAAGLTGKPPT